MAQESKPFGAHLLLLEEGEADEAGRELLDLAVKAYSPTDELRRELGMELQALGDRLTGLNEQVVRPLADRLDRLGKEGLDARERTALGEDVRRLADELSDLGDRLIHVGHDGQGVGTLLRPFGQKAEQLGKRLQRVAERVAGVADRIGEDGEPSGTLQWLLPARDGLPSTASGGQARGTAPAHR